MVNYMYLVRLNFHNKQIVVYFIEENKEHRLYITHSLLKDITYQK